MIEKKPKRRKKRIRICKTIGCDVVLNPKNKSGLCAVCNRLTSNAGGRPTVMTKEVIKKLEDAFSMGCTDVEACIYANISAPPLYDYEKKHPKFTVRKNALKEKPVLKARSNIIRLLNKGDEDTSKWYLERKRKKEFSTRQDVGGNITISPALTTDQQKRLERIKRLETEDDTEE